MRTWVHCLALLCVLLAGCTTGPDTVNLLQALGDRQSCVWYSGQFGGYVHVQGVTATGGLPMRECLLQRMRTIIQMEE